MEAPDPRVVHLSSVEVAHQGGQLHACEPADVVVVVSGGIAVVVTTARHVVPGVRHAERSSRNDVRHPYELCTGPTTARVRGVS